MQAAVGFWKAYVANKLHDGALDLRWHRGAEAHSLLGLWGFVEDVLLIPRGNEDQHFTRLYRWGLHIT